MHGNVHERLEWRWGREGDRSKAKKPCVYFNRGQGCKYGSTCRFSHDSASTDSFQRLDRVRQNAAEETPGQLQARAEYNSWKRIVKKPPRPNDVQTAESLWHGALEILNGKERDWKHCIPKDLDDEAFYGREHIQATISCAMEMRNTTSFNATSYFLQTMAHVSILDCLSVDTFVGTLYNFFSGVNGGRAIALLQNFCNRILEPLEGPGEPDAEIEAAAIALSTALRELLKREQRARLNDDLPVLVDSVENLSKHLAEDSLRKASALLVHQVDEVRAIVDRARGLIDQESLITRTPQTTSASGYPHGLQMPRESHDNDKLDITAMKIFPTREEILSEAADFLPSTDLEQPHFLSNKCQRHIDTQFRLLRHDTFGELKDVVAGLLRASETDRGYLDPRVNFGNFRANRYSNAMFSYVSFESRSGLEADISFSLPPNVREKSASERQRWWEDSGRLSEGVLASFIATHEDQVQHLFLVVSNRKAAGGKDKSLEKDSRHATITMRLTNHDQVDIETLVSLSSFKVRGVLVEFPGVLPTTFVPILENLQGLQRLGSLTFQNWILPDKIEHMHETVTADIPPPRYARSPGFAFSLKPILKTAGTDEADLLIDLNLISYNEDLVDKVEAETDLDRGQCRALIAALSREFVLIQGPPGTGKSYLGVKLMKILLHCQKTADLGPIIVVCYTNHALDQFLEHVLRDGTKKIIRIGGQSHSSLLEEHNLRAVSCMEPKSRSEKYLLAKSYEDLDQRTEDIKRALGRAHGCIRQMKWANVRRYLSRCYPRVCEQFGRIDNDKFETVGRHPFDTWASCEAAAASLSGNHGTETVLDHDSILRRADLDVHDLSPHERQYLKNFWSAENYKQTVDDLFEDIKRTSSTQRAVSQIHDEVDRRVLQEADVIGITTTGLAKRISTLQRLRCKVVICEEAGEVMEPHMLSALLPTVEHFIQIGDHEQLRPQINNFGLSLESKQGVLYQLDRSQFERLSVGVAGRPKIPVAQLEVQRRMRPAISTLIRETIYPNLQDHLTVLGLPNVVGMRKNLFWLDHDHPEDSECSETHHKSHANAWEASMVHAVVRHMVRQGAYSSSDIAVLTPYTGQLQKLRTVMRNDFEVVLSERDQDALAKDGLDGTESSSQAGSRESPPTQKKVALAKKKLSQLLRIATVDNFQGEEAKVVIVSLVRSNQARKVGFLKTTNRINVLLSRAQHGMYLIGNTETYMNVKMWQTVIELMRASNA